MKNNILTIFVMFILVLGCKKDISPTTIKTVSITDIDGISINVETETANNTGTLTNRGICYSTVNTIPTIADSVTMDSVKWGTMKSTIGNLNTVSTYYFRAYIKTTSSVIYGNTLTYKTATLLKDNVYYALINGDISENYYRDKASVKNDTLELKVYYQTTDSFTISRYCSSTIPYTFSKTSSNWYKYYRIGNVGLSYLLVNRDAGFALSGGESAFQMKMNNISYDNAYLTPTVQIICKTIIE